jgi:CheY-like chemotaxis protein
VRHADRRVRVSLLTEPRDGTEGVRLRVEDDGAGIDPALRGRLFSPFARGAADGHGLGLSSTSWLVEQLAGGAPQAGGSSLGGACMEIWFPARLVAPAVAHVPFPLAGLRVVLVDDDAAVRRVLVALLRRERMVAEGLDVGPDLAERLTVLQPDLLLLDRNLGTFSGLDLWRAVRVRDPALARRTALLTGAAEPGDRTADPPVLRKPLDLNALRTFAARALGGSATNPAAAPSGDARDGCRGAATRAYAAAFREVLRALDAVELEAAAVGLRRWTAGIDGGSVPPTLLAELGEAAWMAREAVGQGELGAAREWVERGLALLGEAADAA